MFNPNLPVTCLFCFVLPLFINPKNSCLTAHRVKRIVGGVEANYPPFDDPTVYVRFNGRAAKVTGAREFPHYVFKGIKYAQPPTGKNRLLRPKEKFLEGEVDATTFAPPCLQPYPGRNMVVGTEDCLALNIFTPELPTGFEGLPVVVWIHGGNFRYGSASQYGVRHLVGKQLVVVTIQYRLGSLGFLSTGSKHLPGNAALWDMALAVQWIRNYIGFFGGNPHRIVVMGHGTGASSALLVALSNIAQGIPSGIVAMSGTAVSQWAVDNTPSNTAKQIAEENGCPTVEDLTMVKCLQHIPAESIIRGDSAIEFEKLQQRGFMSGLQGRQGAAPVTEGQNDGRFLPGLVEYDPTESLYKQDKQPKIPLLTGVTKDETSKAVNGQFKPEITNKLKTIPDFMDKVFIQNLQAGMNSVGVNKLFGGLKNATDQISQQLQSFLPVNSFQNYIKAKKDDLNANLKKISEATADALFNVPAFLTAQFWKAPTYLYSFEHVGKMNRGSSFLKGIPLIGNLTSAHQDDNTVGHGDELAYLFEANDLEGNRLTSENQPTEDDLKVQEIFTQMIADFARNGEFKIDNQLVPSFSGTDNNFVQIKPKPVLANKFKFCEMALWTNIGERLKSGYCQFLNGLNLGGIQQTLIDQSKNILKPNQGLGQLGKNIPGINKNTNQWGILGAGSSNTNQNSGQNQRQQSHNPLGGLGRFGRR